MRLMTALCGLPRLWIGGLYEDRDFLGGVVVFDGTNWTHHTPPAMTPYAYGIGQSAGWDFVVWWAAGQL